MAMIRLGILCMSYVILIFSNPLLLSLKGPRVSLLGLVLNLSVLACLYPTVGRYSTQLVSLTNAPMQENVWDDSPTHTHTQSQGTMRTVPLVYVLRTWSSLNQWKPRYTYITMATYLMGTNGFCHPSFPSSLFLLPLPSLPSFLAFSPPPFPPCTQYNFDGVGYLTMEPVTLVSYICDC